MGGGLRGKLNPSYEIRQVANGYMVLPAASYDRERNDNEVNVFNDFDKMVEWFKEQYGEE